MGAVGILPPRLFMENRPNNPDPLSSALKSWKVKAELSPCFEQQVWARISRAKRPSFAELAAAFTAWAEYLFIRPVPAMAYLSALLLIGILGGAFEAQQQVQDLKNQAQIRYVQTVDPYQVPRLR